jgi:serine O-acetyltransferase
MKNGVFSLIAGDMRAKAKWVYSDESYKAILKSFFTDGSAAMIWFRFMQASQRVGLKPLAMLFNKINSMFCGCVIGRGAVFGPNFVLVHSNGVVINSKVIGGKNILVEHGVTIGEEKGEAPVLGDDIFIGAGAKIIGGVIVGGGAKIGANAVVIKDVPEGATAVGVPARNVV